MEHSNGDGGYLSKQIQVKKLAPLGKIVLCMYVKIEHRVGMI